MPHPRYGHVQKIPLGSPGPHAPVGLARPLGKRPAKNSGQLDLVITDSVHKRLPSHHYQLVSSLQVHETPHSEATAPVEGLDRSSDRASRLLAVRVHEERLHVLGQS